MTVTMVPDLAWLWPHFGELKARAKWHAQKRSRVDLTEEIVDDVLRRAERIDFSPIRAKPTTLIETLVTRASVDVIYRKSENSGRVTGIDPVDVAGVTDPEPRLIAALDLERAVPQLPSRRRKRVLSQLGRAKNRDTNRLHWSLIVLIMFGLVWLLMNVSDPLRKAISPGADKRGS